MSKRICIIRRDVQSRNCAGFNYFPAIRARTGQFSVYSEVELIGLDTCGRCGQGKSNQIVSRDQRLKDKGAEVIHLGTCIVGVCPFEEAFVQAIQEKIGIPVVRGTHAKR